MNYMMASEGPPTLTAINNLHGVKIEECSQAP